MPTQDGLRFLFDLQDKITPKLIKLERQSKALAKKIDKDFTRSSKSVQTNTAKAIASEERRAKAAKRSADAQIKAQARIEKAKKKALEASIRRIKRESDAFKRSMTRLASAAAVAFAAVAGKAIQMAGGYDQAMRSVQAKTGATGAVLEKLSAQAREMGRTTVHSATEAARGQAFLAQAGFDANEILQALPATLALATAGELDLASAADIASNVLSGFQYETDQTARVADVLAFAASKTNTNVLQLGSALAKAAPAAKAAGWSLEETTAAIGKLSDAGIQGEEAGTTLNTMLAKLSINGGPAEKLLAKMGITVKDTAGKMLPLNDILSALAPHADDVGLQMELLGTRGAKAGFILGAVAQDARDLTGELKNVSGYAQSAADIMAGGLWGSLKALGSIVDSAYISFGKRFAPALQIGLDLFKKLPAPIQEVVVILGSLVGAMGGLMLIAPQAFGSLVQLPGKLIGLAKMLTITNAKTIILTGATKLAAAAQVLWNAALLANPIGLVVAAVALLAGGLFLLWKRKKSIEEAEKQAAKDYKAELKRVKALKKAADARRKAEKKEAKEKEKAAKLAKKAAKLEEKRIKALKEAEEATEKLKREQDDLRQSFKDTINPSKKLGEKLTFLIDEFDREDVVQRYNKEILAARDASVKYKTKLDPLIASMVDQAEVFVIMELVANNGVSALTKLVDINLVPLSNDVNTLALSQGGLDLALAGVNASIEEQVEGFDEANERMAEVAASSWIDSYREILSPDAIGQTLARAFEGAGGFIGALKSLASRVAGIFMNHMGGLFSTGLKTILPSVFGAVTKKVATAAAGAKVATAVAGTAAAAKVATAAAAAGTAGAAAGTAGTATAAGASGAGGGGILASVSAKLAVVKTKLALGFTKIAALLPGWGWAAAGVAAAVLFFKGWGGPSKAEKEGRATAEAFRTAVKKGLSPEQTKEARKSWQAGWDASVKIVVRDAELAAGKTLKVAEAAGEAMFKALWRAEKAGSKAVISVARQITTILQAGVDATARSVQDINAETAKLKNRTVTIRTVHQGVSTAGPAMFVPSQPGSAKPRDPSGGGVDAKALGKAVADALDGTKVEVDGRKLGRPHGASPAACRRGAWRAAVDFR